jgi:xanthine dehydrogenase iron-sulfur cluster and FAD-binding subunit A
VALAKRSVVSQATATCACGDEAFVVPGPSFAEHEVALFEWLVIVARYAELRPAEAQRVCIEIEMGLASADQPGTYARLTQRFPSLAELAPQLVESPARQARALRMLETILNALSIPGKSMSLSTAPVAVQRREA